MSRRSSQMKFDCKENLNRFRNELRFGGSLTRKLIGRTARPISSKDPMHLVLKSTKATGRFSFGHRSNVRKVNDLVRSQCKTYGIKLIEYSNNFNHLHLLVRFPSRAIYLRFIRSLTGALALAVSGASKLRSLKSIFGSKSFWDFRPFTRVVKSFRGYKVARDYVVLNQLEAMDILPKRKGRLRDVEAGEKHYFR